jgi:nitrile hydratase subunit alpha
MKRQNPDEPSPTAGRYPATDDELELRTRALELAMIDAGLLGSDTVDGIVDHYEREIGPMLGARVIARAWIDPDFHDRLVADATAACWELGVGGQGGERMVALPNTDDVHHVVVCTLCSCYPWPVLGVPPAFYKSPAYRARIVREPRAVLRDDFGLDLDPSVEVRVQDSSADVRYFVIPRRPPETSGLGEDELVAWISRDAMIGVAEPARPR